MQKPVFILASASPRRIALLKEIGITPDKIIPAEIDERPRKGELPKKQAERLALEKLKTVMEKETEGIILAADTVVACGRRVLPKPKTDDEVRACWKMLSGRRHKVFTSVAMKRPDGRILQKTAESIVKFRRVTEPEIESYVQSGEGIGKAGGYAIQGRAATHIQFISGSYSNIVGLPLFEVAQMLRSFGYKL